jgi:hypothetical protein
MFPCDQLAAAAFPFPTHPNREFFCGLTGREPDSLADNSIARPNHELLRPPLISYA